jgi:hypothetical protein
VTDAELIQAAIAASELSARRFAVALLARDERTVRRWLAGDALPATVRLWLTRWIGLSRTERQAVVRVLSHTA